MNNKVLISVMVLSLFLGMATISSADINPDKPFKISIDGDWRLVHNFKIVDLSTGEVMWDKDVAAGDGHEKKFQPNYLYHPIAIYHIVYGHSYPGVKFLIITMFNQADLDLYGDLTWSLRKAYYHDEMQFTYGSRKGVVRNSFAI
ncbi:MAG: hypothetical protein LBR15_01055 [Methanobrevibacter sp.]|jgi:hypothetical protein|nr:hypothetical protein [Candidatus Methanovirga australis]